MCTKEKENTPPVPMTILTKEQFVEYMDFVKEMEGLEAEFDEVIRKISYDGYCSIFSSYQIKFLNLLEQIFLDDTENSDIEYFVYDTEWGKKADEYFITIDNKDGSRREIKFRSSEELYDWLVEDYPNRFKNKNGEIV